MQISAYPDLELLLADHLHQLNNLASTLDAVVRNELKLSQRELVAGLAQISSQIKFGREKLSIALESDQSNATNAVPTAGVEHALKAIIYAHLKPRSANRLSPPLGLEAM